VGGRGGKRRLSGQEGENVAGRGIHRKDKLRSSSRVRSKLASCGLVANSKTTSRKRWAMGKRLKGGNVILKLRGKAERAWVDKP